ncbi:hypothetical protein NONI108955_06340 [Nocardia ninae]|uniref:CobQ/CobB/MinD/ParA nucleotide binding domain-containing protein n=1 Tax=Nocardia ninae NBRC 108245 TaxID=1210091 RepID=A0A511MJU6_9NOCA|nr:hypothetical protein [Nocardia ninae]GEM40912.1 hypothetical protein NN4_54310 [Nocardia ninae NBRC 108245]
MTSATQDELKHPRSIAVVSGKGGAGKTLITIGLAQLLASRIPPDLAPVVLADGDPVTAGLSYALDRGTHSDTNGFLDFARSVTAEEDMSAIWRLLRPLDDTDLARTRWAYLSVGLHESLIEEFTEDQLTQLLGVMTKRLAELGRWTLVDCRGGFDNDTLAICRRVEEIILVVEPDISSVQSSRHLVDVLARQQLLGKLGGFIVNKAFEDPTALARSTLFRSPCLATVPFDIETARRTLVGHLPNPESLFLNHLSSALGHFDRDLSTGSVYRLPMKQFSSNNLSPDLVRGERVALFIYLIIAISLVLRNAEPDEISSTAALVSLAGSGAILGSSHIRRLIGAQLAKIVSRSLQTRKHHE